MRSRGEEGNGGDGLGNGTYGYKWPRVEMGRGEMKTGTRLGRRLENGENARMRHLRMVSIRIAASGLEVSNLEVSNLEVSRRWPVVMSRRNSARLRMGTVVWSQWFQLRQLR